MNKKFPITSFNNSPERVYHVLTDENIDELPQIMKNKNSFRLLITNRYIDDERDERGLLVENTAYTKTFLPDMSPFKDIKELRFMGSKVNDLSPIHDCVNIQSLILHNNDKTDLNYSCFTKLEKLVSWERQGIKKIWNISTLKQLSLENLKKHHYAEGRALKNLFSLSLGSTSIENLDMLEQCENLEYLTLSRMSKLKDISFIEKLHNLRYLSVEAKHVVDFSPLLHLPNLQVLCIEGGKSAPLIKDTSIFFKLKKLQYFAASLYRVADREGIKKYANENFEKYKDKLSFYPPGTIS